LRLSVPLAQRVLELGVAAPARAALVHGPNTVSYAELCERVRAVACLLEQLGVRAGDRVVLAAPSTPAFVYGYLGTHHVGAIAVPVAPGITTKDLQFIADQVEPSAIFLTHEFQYRSYLGRPLEELDSAKVAVDGCHSPRLQEIADILFTTGTTGVPKGVVLTHHNTLAAAANINAFIGNTSDDTEVVPLPLSHSFGLGRLRCNLLACGTVVLVDGFGLIGRIFEAMERHRATGLSSVPAGFEIIFRLTGDKLGEYADHLKYVEIGSASMPQEHKRRLMRLLPNTRLCMHYGLTEASRTTFIEFHESANKLESIGQPTPNVDVGVLGGNGQRLPAGTIGEIAVQGRTVAQGYWKDPPMTAKALVDGWLRTGDSGYQDNEGFLYLVGRSSDLVNVGGLKVAPVEVEEALKEHQSIGDCACVGIRDPDTLAGEAVKVFLVQESAREPKPTDQELVAFLRERLESHKIPALFQWVDAVPRTASGKLQRQLLLK
jgi:long-chain acyl-CoA synthetase